MTVTATDRVTHETSEFSPCFAPQVESAIEFSAANVTASEGDGQVTLTLTRTGKTSGPANCVVRTVNLSARCPPDYACIEVPVSWPAGDAAPRTITVPIHQDDLEEGDETFEVEFVWTTSVRAGAVNRATVTIADDDPEPAAASTPVPTASEWALVTLAALLASAAIRRVA